MKKTNIALLFLVMTTSQHYVTGRSMQQPKTCCFYTKAVKRFKTACKSNLLVKVGSVLALGATAYGIKNHFFAASAIPFVSPLDITSTSQQDNTVIKNEDTTTTTNPVSTTVVQNLEKEEKLATAPNLPQNNDQATTDNDSDSDKKVDFDAIDALAQLFEKAKQTSFFIKGVWNNR